MSNRLAHSESLYLRKHAENPIDWWMWCDEALEKAQAEDKPIFLSIGYSSCHWCTVMEGEAFSDQDIADYMNANFVPIKVDREERPDIDSIYMQALQMMTGQGGWPLNIFLTPQDNIPFYGGTYFPVEPRFGRPGFLELLKALRNFYDQEKEKLAGIKTQMMEALQNSTLLPDAPETALNDELLKQGMHTCTRIVAGAIPGQPSFPMIPYAELVLQGSRVSEDSRQAAKQRGNDLATGGIYDHVAGGFHRYTVDATWTVPHFEKMLYDNGQIVEYLADLWSAGIQEPAYHRAIEGTIQWLKREMTASEGYFYAAQDADSFTTPEDSEPEEGAFYVWKYAELEQVLTPEELKALAERFRISPEGNFEGSNVLQRRETGETVVMSEMAEQALSKLFEVRYGASPEGVSTFPPAQNNQEAKSGDWPGRIPAVTDTKMIVAWNSLMISGLARVYGVFQHPMAWELATKAAQFILDHQWVNGRFHRLNYDGKTSVLAQSEDYALFIKALLDLYQASLHQESPQLLWKEKAIQVQREFDELLWSAELGGYYNAASDVGGDLIIRERSYIDNATPAANGVAVSNLVRLSLVTENSDYLGRAEQTLQAFRSIMEQSPQACPSVFAGLDWYLHGTLVQTEREHIVSLLPQFFPKAVYQVAEALPEDGVGLVCKGLTCLPTARSEEELMEKINKCHAIA
ncbi:thioredoxin domain-containing protein [Spirulina sp. CS-785/01]|uniref:thioredoxin domain-containing protein n=1 Tax=Spirulina sp. CS-785/01 TaxID=3021716 RepID=UPI00232BFD05|nr:thioredoxin domain-containing protein [Spirulina sp. CS-785/01]MDB9314880.1 thioredoxin domain-containing protein [Spirulina sp. CS-785/01]